MLSENTDLVGKTKRLESVLRSERLDSATKESCLKRSTANLQRELDMQKDEIKVVGLVRVLVEVSRFLILSFLFFL